MTTRRSTTSAVLLLLCSLQTTRAFVSRTRQQQQCNGAPPLLVSIGLGPEEEQLEKKELVPGVDYEIPNHEAHRLDRRSKLDERCDTWIASLIPETLDGAFRGDIAQSVYVKLTTVPVLENERGLPKTDKLFTPFVTTELPWNVIRPAYGLEAFGLPSIRRNAEAWRHFDVNSMIGQSIGKNQKSLLDSDAIQSQLIEAGAFLDDADCAARLVYVNGHFQPELSKLSDGIENMDSVETLDEDTKQFLNRLTDGFTDELVTEVPVQEGEPLKSYQRLSEPNHNMGKPTTQFAINTQQGTAVFCAINTLSASCFSCVRIKESVDQPIQIVHAVTETVGQVHPRTLIVAEKDSKASIVQQSVSIVEDSSITSPILHNGFTQILLRDNTNITHCLIEESGGMPISGVEQSDEAIREAEAARTALKHTVLETLDVHCAGEGSNYTGAILNLGGNGRSKIATCITLLKPTSSCELNGFSLCGGTCRSDIKTNIHHIANGCRSEQLQKNMVGGRATTSFRGRIRVDQSAQQTDSQQLSRTVLLTDLSRAWAVPSLEIIADDVSCTHGATVSDLSEEELFYLQSRGLSAADARNLLMFAFCNDILDDIPVEVLGALKTAQSTDENGLRMRILRKLQNLVPTGKRAVKGEYQSI